VAGATNGAPLGRFSGRIANPIDYQKS